MRESFIFYKSFYEAIKLLPRDIQGEIYTAIMEYGLYGRETESLKPVARSIFTLIKPQLDINNQRFANGKKGGRPQTEPEPSGNQTGTGQKPGGNQTETKPKPNDNQSITKPKPNGNQTETKPEPNDNVNDNIEKTSTGVDVKKKVGKDVMPDYVREDYAPVFARWLDYKRARREGYKSAASLKACYDKLVELGGNDPAVAELVVEQSMANNYAGLFPLKNNANENNQGNSAKRQANDYALARYLAERERVEKGVADEGPKPF